MPFGNAAYNNYVDADLCTTMNVQGKPYKLFFIVTPEALNNFTEEYLVKEKPNIIGWDCEAGYYHDKSKAGIKHYHLMFPSSKITVLQLATSKWLCIIDIHLLSKKMTDDDWKTFFIKLFNHGTTFVGFDIGNDARYIYARFRFIKEIIAEHPRLYCISKLSDYICKNADASEIVFGGWMPEDRSLAALSSVILDIHLNKDLQSSNWTRRPLSSEQKSYAVKDALVPWLLKEEILHRLESDIGVDKAIAIMKNGEIKITRFF